MAHANAFFQLGMDLDPGRSTAQTEETSYAGSAPVTPARDRAAGQGDATEKRAASEARPGAEPASGAQHVEPSERTDFCIERAGARYAGTQLIVDLFEAERLDDLAHVEATLEACVEAAGATLLHLHLHHFTPNNGVSGVAVLAESHISIHSWPERGYAALDVFMCGRAEPRATIEVLRRAFTPGRLVVEEHLRGRL